MPKNQTQLTPYNQPVNAPVARPDVPSKYVPWQFGRTQSYQGRLVKVSKAIIKNPGTLSALKTKIGTIGAGSTMFYTMTLTPLAPHVNEMNYAIPYIAVYEGTARVTANQIYPNIGTSKSWGTYSFQGANDWEQLSQTIPGSVISAYTLAIHNNQGIAGTIYIASQFKYFNFNAGSVL